MGNILGSSQDSSQKAKEQRHLVTNQPQMQTSNRIKSTSTNIITFIPLNLYQQLKLRANIYFIIIACFQLIPQISVTGGKPTTLVPLTFVMLTVLIKDAYQQFHRYLSDRRQNNRPTQILSPNGDFVKQVWQNIKVGHIIKIRENQSIPCDALILKSISKNKENNNVYLQTKSLDGETSLKVRYVPQTKNNVFEKLSIKQLLHKNYQVQFEQPDKYIEKFFGSIAISPEEKIPLSIENMVLRGCVLKTVPQIICVCIYAGPETKVKQNGAQFAPKLSKLMHQVSKMVITIFIWQVVIALVLALFNLLFQVSYSGGVMQYIQSSKFLALAGSWWLIMSYFVPISLIVTVQLVKLFQGKIVANDELGRAVAFDEIAAAGGKSRVISVDSDQSYISANNTTINQNLGQIRYVFSDKTGTLTKNEMKFRKIIVNGKIYGQEETISQDQIKQYYPAVQKVNFRDRKFMDQIQSQPIQAALRTIYLCHQIFMKQLQNGKFQYTSGSPDQLALINFAKLCGYQFLGYSSGCFQIYHRKSNRIIKYQKLALLKFDSDRKRMSVVVRNPKGQIELLTKGADSYVEKLLKRNPNFKQQTDAALNKFSQDGLRTFLLARRVIHPNQFNNWIQIYKNAQLSLDNRKDNLNNCYDLIQKQLEIVGGTAVEDELQQSVADTIKSMKAAGIKFFILTGDKKQTAISIGRSCGLIEPGAQIIQMPQYHQQTGIQWQEEFQRMKSHKGQKVFLLDGSKPLPRLIHLHQTICYRCTPSQKAEIIGLVKDLTPELTLAIGDGANDVNMIVRADVGIGVRGKEGTQATRVADYAVGSFYLLSFLTLYYGREWYTKNCRLVSYNFFKNWYHVSAVIVYGAYTYFSSSVIFDIYLYELFNVFFASLPIIVYGVFDYQFSYYQSIQYPDIYEPGLKNIEFNQTVYYKSIGRGVIYGFVSLLIVFMCLQDDFLDQRGRTGYLAQSGAVLYASIIINVNLRILLLSSGIRPIIYISVIFSIAMYWAAYFLKTTFIQSQLTASFYEQFTTIPIYLIHIILITGISLAQYAYTKYCEYEDKVKRQTKPKKLNKKLLEMIVAKTLQLSSPVARNGPNKRASTSQRNSMIQNMINLGQQKNMRNMTQ